MLTPSQLENFERTGRKARKLIKKLIGEKKYRQYARTGKVLLSLKGKVYEVEKQTSEVLVFNSRADYNKYTTHRKQEGCGGGDGYHADWCSPVDFQRWCVLPDYDRLNCVDSDEAIYEPGLGTVISDLDSNGDVEVHEDEMVLTKVILLKFNVKKLRQAAHVTYVDKERKTTPGEDYEYITRRRIRTRR